MGEIIFRTDISDRLFRGLSAIVDRLPAPGGDVRKPLRALVFDSFYDTYRGVVLQCRVKEGTARPGQKIRLMHTGSEYSIEEVGLLQLKKMKTPDLPAGSVASLRVRQT